MAGGWWIVTRLASEERVINRRLSELIDAAEIDRAETSLSAAAAAREVTGYFTQDVSIKGDPFPYSISSRGELGSVVFQARRRLSRLTIGVRDRALNVQPGEAEARMDISVKLEGDLRGRWESEWQMLTLGWVRTNREWKISSVAPLETIRRPE